MIFLGLPGVLLTVLSECSVTDLTSGSGPDTGADASALAEVAAAETSLDDGFAAETQGTTGDAGTGGTDAAPVSDIVLDASSWDAPPTGAVLLQNALNQQYLDVADASLSDNAQIVTASLTGRSDQYWTFSAMSDTSYEILNSASGKCLDDQRGLVGAGTTMIQFACNGNSNQRWYLVNNQGNLTIVGQLSGRCLASQSLSNPDVLIINDCSPTSLSQQWFIPR